MASAAAAPEVDYDKLLKLFNSPHSAELYDRHVAVVERVCRVNAKGFAIRDLHHAETILRFVVDKCNAGLADLFGDVLCKLLKVLTVPYVRRTATDEFKMLNSITSICAAVAEAFSPAVPVAAQLCAAEMLSEFASAHGQRPSVMELPPGTGEQPAGPPMAPVPRAYHLNQGLLERSGAVQQTVLRGFIGMAFPAPSTSDTDDAAASPPPDAELQYALTKTLLNFSYHKGNASLLLSAGVLEPLCRALALDYKLHVVPVAVELLWNLLENAPTAAAVAATPAAAASFASTLAQLTHTLLQRGYSVADKELRNELFVIAELASTEEATRVALAQAGFFKMAAAVAVAPELLTDFYTLPAHALTVEPEDLELKRLAWAATAALCATDDNRVQAETYGFFDALLSFVDLERAEEPSLARWKPDQKDDLVIQALSILYKLAPAAAHHLTELRAGSIVLHYVRVCSGPTGDAAVRLLRRMATVPELVTELGADGALDTALDLLGDPSTAVEVRQDAASVLTTLCCTHDANQSLLRAARGIPVLVETLGSLASADHTLPSPLAVAVVACVWRAVVPSRKNLVRFLAAQGLDALLDLLEVCNPFVYPVILSCLADVAANDRSHPFFHEWVSSRSSQNCAAHLLLDIWRAEEKARVMVDQQGAVAAPERPLDGTAQRLEWIPSLDVAYTFQSRSKKAVQSRLNGIVTGDGILAKVYAVFSKLGFDNFPYLPPLDQSTLATVQKFVVFRQGEVWQDIAAELNELAGGDETKMPTEGDQARLESGVHKSFLIAKELAVTQKGLYAQYLAGCHESNAAFFRSTMQLAQDEANAKVYKKEQNSLSMKERLEAKLKKEQMLTKSFDSARTKKHFQKILDVDYGPEEAMA